MSSSSSSSLSVALVQVVDTYVQAWIQLLAETHPISVDTLQSSWNQFIMDASSTSGKTGSTDDPALSKTVPAYVHFCNVNRKLLKDRHPSMSFGELSKELGRLWRDLSEEERQAYRNPRVPPSSSSASSAQARSVQPHVSEEETLEKKTLVELRQMCSERSLKKTGNKEILIRRLMDHMNQEHTMSVAPPVSFPFSPDSHHFTNANAMIEEEEGLTFEEETESLCNHEDDEDDDASNTSNASFQFDDDDGDASIGADF